MITFYLVVVLLINEPSTMAIPFENEQACEATKSILVKEMHKQPKVTKVMLCVQTKR